MPDLSQYKISSNDSQVETVGGMKKRDASRILAFCQGVYGGKQLMIIVRGSKPTSLRHHFGPDVSPKPMSVKDKIPYESGVLETDEGRFISDYDLQGVYELRDNGAYYRLYVGNGAHARPQGPLENPFLGALNRFVHPTASAQQAFFQHGPNDDYLDCGRPLNTGIGDVFLAFLPNGDLYLLPERGILKEFYHQERISWNYQLGAG